MQLYLPPYPMIAAVPDMPADLRAGLEELRLATGYFLIVVHRYEMYRAIARDMGFVARINLTTAAEGLNTFRGALAASIVVSLMALFDRNRSSTSLARVLDAILSPAAAKTFAVVHPRFTFPIDAAALREALGRLRSRLSREPLRGALERMRDLRNQEVAHLDTNPSFPKGRAITGDIDLIYAVAANIIVKANRFCGVNAKVVEIRATARTQALALCQSIQPMGITGGIPQ